MKERSPGPRLREERHRLGFNQPDFAKLGGVSKNTQLAYENGTSSIPIDYLLQLERHGLDVSFVASGLRTSDMLKMRRDDGPGLTNGIEDAVSKAGAASSSSVSTAVTHDAALAERFNLRLIPEVDIAYSMGGGALTDDIPDSRLVPFRQDWLDRLTRGFKSDVFLARGQGDSMMPTILDDDDVLVNRADNVVRHQDRIWALGYGELGMIKRVRRLPSGQFQLNSDNPAVSPIEATEDELFVVGRVIWIGRRV